MKARSNTEHVLNVLASEADKAAQSKADVDAGEEPVFLASDYVDLLRKRLP